MRAHQHAAGTREGAPADDPEVHAIDRTHHEIHLAADGRRRLLAFVSTAGQADDAPALADVMADTRSDTQV